MRPRARRPPRPCVRKPARVSRRGAGCDGLAAVRDKHRRGPPGASAATATVVAGQGRARTQRLPYRGGCVANVPPLR